MKVLIACEFSGIVRDAFLALGHDAWSCDLIPSESIRKARSHCCDEMVERHFVGDVLALPHYRWDLIIAHPPCTFLANSSNKHLYIGKKMAGGPCPERWQNMRESAAFFNALRELDAPRICLENPIQHKHARALIPKYQQIVQPWMFGHAETKATCLWLKNLPALVPTKTMPKPHAPRVHFESPGPDRWKNRSRTMTGIASAMAVQWGRIIST